MSSATVALAVAMLVIAAALMVVAAFWDRHRAREIQHDPSRLRHDVPQQRGADLWAHRHDGENPHPPGP